MNLVKHRSLSARRAAWLLSLAPLVACASNHSAGSGADPRADEPVAAHSAALTGSTRVVGYYTGNVDPSTIPYGNLTHLNMAFAQVDTSGNISPPNSVVSQVVGAAHQAGVKVLVSVGGGTQSQTTILNNLMQQSWGPGKLASSIQTFVSGNGLDGVDIDWEGVCNGCGGAYQTLIQQLRSDLQPGTLITAAVDAWGTYFTQNIPPSTWALLDQVNAMAYDLDPTGDPSGNPNAPYSAAQKSIAYWAGLVPGSHVNLGVPFFGRTVSNSPPSMGYTDIVAANSGAPSTDTYTDSSNNVFFYDDIADVQKKTQLAQSYGAGVMIWELDFDTLGQPSSLLTAIANQANPPQGGQGYSCYWMENWAPWSFVQEPSLTYQQCYQKDGCYGGQNGSGGGCYKWATSTSAPPTPWSADSCYWMENWSPWTFVQEPGMTYQQCYQKDGCYGGQNGSGGGCYKWAASPGGSRAPWTCAAVTCSSLGLNCGTASNGCGGTLNCGGCPSGQACGASTPNVCGAAAGGLELWILPDYDNATKTAYPNGVLAGFISNTTVKPYGVSNYMTIHQGGQYMGFNQSGAQGFIDEALANGVHHVSISLNTDWRDTDESAGLSALQSAVAYGQGKGVTVYVRFGYEMNGNWSPSYNNGNPAVFKATWAEVAGAVHAGGGKMVWAPNVNVGGGTAGYQSWLPNDTSTIDIVGFDKYHQNGGPGPETPDPSELDTAIGSIYPVVQQLGKPFILTETGVRYYDTSGWWPVAIAPEVSEKQTWLNMVVAASLRAKYPSLVGFGWFDYNKQETVNDGSLQYCDFSVSQQPPEASMFKAWVAANASSLQLQ